QTSEPSGGGTASMPVRKKGRRSPSYSLRVPSHVPSHPQTAAKVRGFSLTASGFTAETDWLLEQSGFELPVPSAGAGFSAAKPGSDQIADGLVASAWCQLPTAAEPSLTTPVRHHSGAWPGSAAPRAWSPCLRIGAPL